MTGSASTRLAELLADTGPPSRVDQDMTARWSVVVVRVVGDLAAHLGVAHEDHPSGQCDHLGRSLVISRTARRLRELADQLGERRLGAHVDTDRGSSMIRISVRAASHLPG